MISIELATTIVIVFLFVLLFIETPIAYALGASGLLGIVLLRGADVAASNLGSIPFGATNNYSLVIIPMYVLLGMFALEGGLAKHLYALASTLLRRLPGGLGVATVAACAGFAAISGSSVATVATIGKLCTIEMRRYGYPPALAGGIVAAAGTLGILIPPSILIVMYAIMANVSIGKMLVAGIIPGVIIATVFAVYVAIRVKVADPFVAQSGVPDVSTQRLEPALAGAHAASGTTRTPLPPAIVEMTPVNLHQLAEPLGPRSGVDGAAMVAEEKLSTSMEQIRSAIWMGLIVAAVLAGMFTGAFTVIESAAVAAALALVMLVVEVGIRRPQQIGRKVWAAGKSAVGVTAMVFSLVIGATILTQFLVMARVPARFADWVGGLDVPPSVIIAIFLVGLIPLGMFLESMSIILVVAPLVAPVVVEMGYDPIWFGILFVILLELGLITPPVGMNVFVASTISGIRIETLFKGVLPFVVLILLVVGVLFAAPDVVTWLPSILSQ